MMNPAAKDAEIMAAAYKEALKAYKRKECPVGAVLLHKGKIIARAGNRETASFDPTAHAEILVLRQAGKILKRHTFPDCTLYTTLWPCPMCENSLLRAKIPKVIVGARSFEYIFKETFNPSQLLKIGPIMEEKCRQIYLKWVSDRGYDFLLQSKIYPLDLRDPRNPR